MYEKALNIQIAKFGADHPYVAPRRLIFSYMLGQQGQYRKAMKLSIWWWIPLFYQYVGYPVM